jgi:hypothetical protein
MTSPLSSTDLLKSDFADQQIWKACIGLDLAARTVVEAEVLADFQQKSLLTHQCARSGIATEWRVGASFIDADISLPR